MLGTHDAPVAASDSVLIEFKLKLHANSATAEVVAFRQHDKSRLSSGESCDQKHSSQLLLPHCTSPTKTKKGWVPCMKSAHV